MQGLWGRVGVSETMVFDLGGRAAPGPVTPPQPAVEVGHFDFFYGDMGGYNDALIIDTSTMTLYRGTAESWLQDPRNYPAQLGFSADDIRALLVAHAPDTLAAAHSGGAPAGAAADSHATTLSLPGETELVALDAATVFQPAGSAGHGFDLGAFLHSANPMPHPSLEYVHPAIV
jgi:hypothetical protein